MPLSTQHCAGAMRTIDVTTSRVATVLALLTSVVWLCGTIANYLIHRVSAGPNSDLGKVLSRFDLGHEPSIPAFHSALLLLLSASMLGFLARFDFAGGAELRRFWGCLGVLMAILAIDEAVMFHEMGDAAMRITSCGDLIYFSWIIPGGIFAAVIGLLSLRFLLRLPRRTGSLMFLSGMIFVAGAVGMESIAGLIFAAAPDEQAAQKTLAHIITQSIEEGLEMTGVIVFICSLSHYIQSTGIKIHVESSSGAGSDSPRKLANSNESVPT